MVLALADERFSPFEQRPFHEAFCPPSHRLPPLAPSLSVHLHHGAEEEERRPQAQERVG